MMRYPLQGILARDISSVVSLLVMFTLITCLRWYLHCKITFICVISKYLGGLVIFSESSLSDSKGCARGWQKYIKMELGS